MENRKSYDTVSQAMNDLMKRGYTTDFSLKAAEDCIVCKKSNLSLSADEFVIDEIYRFEGETDPGDEMILYAISSDEHQVKGMILNAYGIYADSETSKIVKELEKHL